MIELLNEMRGYANTGKMYKNIIGECLLLEDLFNNKLNEGEDSLERQYVLKMIENNQFDTDAYEEFANDLLQNKRTEFLTHYTPDELREMRIFRVPGYPIGFALKNTETGVDIVGVHNNSNIGGIGTALIQAAIDNGGTQLDHFDGYLSDFYKKQGFEEYDRWTWDDQYAPEDWKYEENGRPDVVLRRLKK